MVLNIIFHGIHILQEMYDYCYIYNGKYLIQIKPLRELKYIYKHDYFPYGEIYDESKSTYYCDNFIINFIKKINKIGDFNLDNYKNIYKCKDKFKCIYKDNILKFKVNKTYNQNNKLVCFKNYNVALSSKLEIDCDNKININKLCGTGLIQKFQPNGIIFFEFFHNNKTIEGELKIYMYDGRHYMSDFYINGEIVKKLTYL